MPNEEEIILDVIEHYKKVSASGHYSGVFNFLVVWNSPRDHPHILEKLKAVSISWPSLRIERNVDSTSKVDNLNFALGIVNTEIILCIDADTIVNAGTMCRASIKIIDEG